MKMYIQEVKCFSHENYLPKAAEMSLVILSNVVAHPYFDLKTDRNFGSTSLTERNCTI